MSHDLDITNGQASFVSAREDAWHQLGRTLDHSFTAEEAMEEGLLGSWNVRKVPVFARDENGLEIPVAGRAAVLRTNPVDRSLTDVLGDVGEGYRIIQNEEHAAFLNALVDESGAHFETAGAIDGGRKVFITMKLPGHMKIGGCDEVETHLAAINSHDGSMSFTMMPTPVRIVCKNTLNAAFQGVQNVFRVRHTSGATRNITEQARRTLDLSFSFLEGFQQEAEQLINTTVTQSQFEQIISKEFGAPEDSPAATVTRCENKIEEMVELFAQANTQKGIRDTAWAGFNALAEWSDHFAPVRGSERERVRAQNAILSSDFKNQALRLMTSV